MELTVILEALRNDYIAYFETAFEQEAKLNEELFAEIALQISGGVYNNLYVVDLMSRNDGESNIIEIAPTDEIYSGNTSAKYNSLSIDFDLVSWDALRFTVMPVPEEFLGFDSWFEKWIDLEGTRKLPDERTSRVIHSARINAGVVSVDFGSAPVEAVFELFKLFQENGVEHVQVISDRTE